MLMKTNMAPTYEELLADNAVLQDQVGYFIGQAAKAKQKAYAARDREVVATAFMQNWKQQALSLRSENKKLRKYIAKEAL
jgi:hypothetical protein